jgi:hypothetical protein
MAATSIGQYVTMFQIAARPSKRYSTHDSWRSVSQMSP